MNEQHHHDYWDQYVQPRIDEGIILAKCECGDVIERNAEEVFAEAYKMNAVYLYDFNSHEPTIERQKRERARGSANI